MKNYKIAEFLNEWMVDNGVMAVDLAKATGIGYRHINRIRRSDRGCGQEAFDKLSKVVDFPPELSAVAIPVGGEKAPDRTSEVRSSPPCDSCKHSERCARLRLSCSAFGAFTRGQSWRAYGRNPAAKWFVNQLFDDAEAKSATPIKRVIQQHKAAPHPMHWKAA